MAKSLIELDDEARDSASAFETISLDCANEFLDEADFPDLAQEYLQKLCRDFFRKDSTLKFHRHELVAETFKLIEQTLGIESKQKLESWIQDGEENYREEADEMNSWLPLFGRLADFNKYHRHLQLLPLNLPDDKLFSLKYHYLYCIAKIHKYRWWRCETEKRELSEWDKFVFGTYVKGTSILDWISIQVTFRYTRNLWREINNLLSPDEMKTLLAWATEQAILWKMEIIPTAKYLIK